jgi:two-component sensor histidine kinase
LQLLAREVDHRARNMLSLVQSIVSLTQAEKISDFVNAVGGRIQALAHAHSLLAQSRWEGADLKRLIEEELAPFRGPRGPLVELAGPNLVLAPSAAQSITMVIHELATNAAKHGALTASEGRLSVRWSISDDKLAVSWREAGGPPVQEPAAQGFGMHLVSRTIHDQLHGEVELFWEREGFHCEINLRTEMITRYSEAPRLEVLNSSGTRVASTGR